MNGRCNRNGRRRTEIRKTKRKDEGGNKTPVLRTSGTSSHQASGCYCGVKKCESRAEDVAQWQRPA
jgi:hypothetical protein